MRGLALWRYDNKLRSCDGKNPRIQLEIASTREFPGFVREFKVWMLHYLAGAVLNPPDSRARAGPLAGVPGRGRHCSVCVCCSAPLRLLLAFLAQEAVVMGVRCRWGRHRSVAFSSLLSHALRQNGLVVTVNHLSLRRPCDCAEECRQMAGVDLSGALMRARSNT